MGHHRGSRSGRRSGRRGVKRRKSPFSIQKDGLIRFRGGTSVRPKEIRSVVIELHRPRQQSIPRPAFWAASALAVIAVNGFAFQSLQAADPPAPLLVIFMIMMALMSIAIILLIKQKIYPCNLLVVVMGESRPHAAIDVGLATPKNETYARNLQKEIVTLVRK